MPDVLDCSAILIIIAVSSPYIAISYPFLLVIFWFIQKVYLRTSSQIRLLELAAKGPLFTQFLETVDGLVTIRALGWQRKINRQQHQLIENSQRPFYLLLTIQRWLTLALDLLVAGMAVLLVVLAVVGITEGFSGINWRRTGLRSSALKAGRCMTLSVQLRPRTHLRDQIYRKIIANQMSRIKNFDNMICGSSSLKRARSSAFLAAAQRITRQSLKGILLLLDRIN
jgi:ABC-type multidrug transport system fused ATPase/permease subunit